MDLLEFESAAFYFDEPLHSEASRCLDQAAKSYGSRSAEASLMRAYFLEPEHPVVLVALYRYFFYQHRLQDALLVADRVLRVLAGRLKLPQEWQDLDETRFCNGVMVSMTLVRFYMMALKGAGYLELRLGEYDAAIARLEKVVELDTKNRLDAQALIDVARDALSNGQGAVSM
jgi:tetratricopeptide (TPR) repeat protein